MSSGESLNVTYRPELPLAMYRELETHLSQVQGIKAALISQDSVRFDYGMSQIAGLRIDYRSELAEKLPEQAEVILNYYGNWQSLAEIPEFGTQQSEVGS